jgi:YHS domain-containing protein
MRFLIILALIYLAYRAIKSWMLPTGSSKNKVSRESAGKIDDVMVKDPYCEVYFPKRNGVHLKINGKDLYFCSTTCRDNYIKSHSKTNA